MSPNGNFENPQRPIRVLSDLHLGHPLSTVGALSELSELFPENFNFILNGDSVENLYDIGQSMVSQLRERIQDLGGEVIFLTGNHDPRISEIGWLWLAEKKIFLTHGDMVLKEGSPWSLQYHRKKELIQEIILRSDVNSLEGRWSLARELAEIYHPPGSRFFSPEKPLLHLLSIVMSPSRVWPVLRAWLGIRKDASRFLKELNLPAEVFIFGHFHRAGDWHHHGKRIINTGAFMRGSKSAVVDIFPDGEILFKLVKRRRDGSFHC